MKKRFIAIWMTVLMLLPLCPATAFAETLTTHAAEIDQTADLLPVAESTCGDGVTWNITQDGILTISGEGDMRNYSCVYDGQPWRPYEESITGIRIEGTVNSIGSFAFYGMDIQTVVIEDGVTSIGQNAFSGSKLTALSLPDSVTTIGAWAFSYCIDLVTAEIGSGVTQIGAHAFYSCGSLAEIRVNRDNPAYSSDSLGVLFDKAQTTLLSAPGAISGNYAIPESVTSISTAAFYACDNLTGLVIPDSVTTIGTFAFQSCYGLSCVELGSGLTTISNDAFSECTHLTTLIIPNSVTTIGDDAFSDCSSLVTLEIGSGVTAIGGWAFEYCSSLRDILFRGDAPVFGKNVFSGITATVSYPGNNSTWTNEVRQNYGGNITWVSSDGVQDIASGWSGYTQWTLTDDGTLTIYGEGNMKNYDYTGNQPWLNKGVEITSVVVEDGVTAIGSGAFRELTTLKSVTLPESSLTRIGEAAFYGCSSLKELCIPEGIYTIWAYTFKNCTALENIRLPKTLEKIDQGAFENCTGLSELFLPTNVNIIGSWSFKGCTALTEADMQWTDATEIREGAFKKCSALTQIILPPDIQVLGDSCFYGIGAETFTVPPTVTTVEPWCFARASIQEISFKGNAPAIGEGAFNKITVTAKYPIDNSTWTADIMQNYGGTVIWSAV